MSGNYNYRLDGGDWFGVASASTTLVIPGLVNGTSYTVEVRAESAVGAGDASAPATGTPEAVPGAPTISSLSAEPGAISVAFTPGFSGGSSIAGYEYSLGGGAWTAASGTSSPLSITGLADGVTYSVRLRAVNGVGAGTASAAASVTTPDVPGAPDVTAVTPGDGSVTIAFTPGATGGSPIESYQYRTSAGGTWTTATSVSSPITLTGLANGAALAVSLRAVNAVGAGAASAPVDVTPATVPSAPTIIGSTVASGSGELSTSFTAPSSDGGAAITTYQYSTDGGATWHDRTDGGDTASPVVVTVLSSDGTTPLTGGATYPIELRAVNSAGAGTASATAAGLAVTVPLAPVIDAVSALPGALRTTFSAASNGGSPITGYSYSVDGGSTWTSTGTLGTTFTITGLTNGTGYPVKVRAENAVGAGAASGAVSGTPVDLPGRASIASVVRGDRTLRATVSLADDGGSPVTAWQYSTDAGATWATASGTTSPLVITTLSSDGATALENGTAYALQVRAVTAVGTGPASTTTNVAPAAAPAAPSIALTAGDGSIAIAFALGTDGGSPITGLDYSVDGGASWVAAGTLSSPLTVSGLANGTAYTVRLRADNAIGTGTPSAASSATPRTVPGVPTGIVATPDSSSADVSWTAPASDGGAPVTGYTASAYATGTGGAAIASCTTTGTTSCSIPGLTNGTAYYVAVVASNAAGAGAASAPRAVVTPLQRPGAPTIGSVTAGDGTLSVAFTAGSAGDSPITGYQVSLDGGVTWAAASGTTSPILLSGLTNGTAYSVRLRAVSAAGVGTASNAVSGTPVGYPGAPDPTTIVANGGNGRITVSWAAADMNGGTLQSYTATAFTALTSGSTAGTCTTSTLSCTITGLSNGTTYYVSLQTLNTAGMYSVRSAPRVPATPNTTPGAPTGVVATAGDAQATVNWTAPTSTGASALTGYTVLCSAAGGAYTSCGTVAADTTSAVIPLTNGVSYTFEVKATNGNGTGPASAASAAVVPLAPGVVPSFSTPARTTDGFTASITNFDSGATYTVSTGSGSVVRSGADLTVTGLAAGASAEVTVTVAKSGSATVSGSVTGSALAAGVAPAIADVTATTDGLTFVIANYDPSLDYHGSASPAGVVVIDAAGHGTVTGESGGTTVTVTVTATDPGVSTASASADATVLLLGAAPSLSASTPLAGGYRFTIEDYDPSTTYSFDESHGGTVVQVGAIVTVSGLAAGVSSETTVTAVSPGHAAASSTASGTSFPSGTAPETGAVTRTVDGFSFGFTAVPGTVYSATSDAGVVTLDGTTVTVTGLAPGATTTVHLTASAAGTLDSTTDVAGTAIAVGTAARFAAPASRTGGFTVVIEDYSAELTYLLTSSAGTATRSGAVITVAGLGSGAQATVTVTVRRDGYTDASSSVTGTALTPSSAPTAAATPVPTETPTTAPSPTPGWASASGSGSTTSTASGPSESAPGDGAASVGGRSTPVTLSRSGGAVTLAAQAEWGSR